MTGPSLKTALPGPKAQAIIERAAEAGAEAGQQFAGTFYAAIGGRLDRLLQPQQRR